MSIALTERCDFQPGDIIDGKYAVKKTLGEGSFGVVYLVEDCQFHQSFALKLLRLWDVPSEIRQPLKSRFKMEFETGQIACDNLVQSLNYGNVKGNPYILMEYCPGGDLNPYLGRRGTDVSGICFDILSGLNALHQRGKVHRDLKPENILFKNNSTAALTDFGIIGDSRHRMTHIGIFGRPDQVFGTYAYMPPEQANRARRGATVLPTTDVFSFGVLVYQLLTGKLPFGTLECQDDLAEYLKRGKEGDWNRAPLKYIHNGDQWASFIGACLMPDYRQRFQSAIDIQRHLPTDSQREYKPHPMARYPQASPIYTPKTVVRGYCLHILQGEEYGRNYDLTNFAKRGKRMLTVGRCKDNILYVKSDFSDFISRRHCTIESDKSGTQWMVRDGQWLPSEQRWQLSRNGTFVNSRPVGTKGYYLQPGDIITLGDVTFRFENY